MENYNNYYILFHKIISYISNHSKIQLISSDIYDNMSATNLPKLVTEMKKHSNCNEQLFKKFPLRHLNYISPSHKATMKSIIKHLESKSTAIIINEETHEIKLIPGATSELLVSSKMRIMALYSKFLDSIRSANNMSNYLTMMNNQININKLRSEKFSAIIQRIISVMISEKDVGLKIKNLFRILNEVEESEKKEFVVTLLSSLNEWLSTVVPEGVEVDNKTLEYDGFVQQIKDILTESNVAVMCEILSNFRMMPNSNESNKNRDLNNIKLGIEVINSYLDNALVSIDDRFMKLLCRLIHTIRIAVGDTVSKSIPKYKDIILDMKKCFTIDIANGVSISRIPNTTPSYPIVCDLIEKVAIKKEDVGMDYLVNTITTSLNNESKNGNTFDRNSFYRNLAVHNIEWSDEYLSEYFTEVSNVITSLLSS